jgi:hypothetical protein
MKTVRFAIAAFIGLAVLGFAFCSKPTFGDGYTYNYTGVPFTLFQGLTCSSALHDERLAHGLIALPRQFSTASSLR